MTTKPNTLMTCTCEGERTCSLIITTLVLGSQLWFTNLLSATVNGLVAHMRE
jgi:hypothetical protein